MGTITVTNVGKAYKRYPNRWARLAEWVVPGSRKRHDLTWVLKEINFTVNPGEAVGILGVNGAGKSTLLKIITGTTLPTTGSVKIEGRVAALLELGMGFHPDFTGRQNVYMAAQLQGLKVDVVDELMPEIEAFSEIGEYIDQPVRVYSSGMQIRLAFAVSTAVRPDILIIDEALSVGDAAFGRKCFQRIEEFREKGTTLLFVSHDMEAVKKLCNRALFINEGIVAGWGTAKTVCDQYERHLFGNRTDSVSAKNAKNTNVSNDKTALFDPSLSASCEMIYGNGKADIEACWLEDENGSPINVIESEASFHWRYRVRLNEDIDSFVYALMFKTKEGVAIYGTDSKTLGAESGPHRAGEVIEVDFKLENRLAPGIYYVNCGIKEGTGGDFLSRRVDAAILRVTSSDKTSVVSGLVEMRANLSLIAYRPEDVMK
ncbi:ABC transporter ATP-binding protein [Marinobacter sp. C2H3]|uniref:ABC transporter ATP-binding protein n=1 Tax=Marinobacter sp. C2H3 TaxID=3119003 RepID=UPI00300ED620